MISIYVDMTYYYDNKKYQDYTKIKYNSLEYQKCYKKIIDNIKHKKTWTRYYVPIKSPKEDYYDWDPVIVSHYIFLKMQEDGFRFTYVYPNRFIIYHPPMISKYEINDKKKIYSFMRQQHYKSMKK